MAFKNKDKLDCFNGMWVENSGFVFWLPYSLFAHNCSEIWLQSVCTGEMFLLWWMYTLNNSLAISKLFPPDFWELAYTLVCLWHILQSPVACWIWIPPLKGRSCHFIPLQPSINLMSSVLHVCLSMPWWQTPQHSRLCSICSSKNNLRLHIDYKLNLPLSSSELLVCCVKAYHIPSLKKTGRIKPCFLRMTFPCHWRVNAG